MATYSQDFTALSTEDPLSNSGAWATAFGGGLRVVNNGGSNNVQVGSANTYQGSLVATGTGTYGTSQYAEVVIGSNTGSSDSVGPAGYMAASSDNGYYIQIGGIGTSSNNRIFKNVAGTHTDLFWTGGVTINIGDKIGIELSHSGGTSTLTSTHAATTYDGDGFPTNGTTAQTTDTSLSSGQAGMIGYNGNVRAGYASSFYSAGYTGAGGTISAVDSPVLDAETGNILTVSGFGASVNDVDIRAVQDNNHNVDVSFSGTDPNLTFDMPDVSAFTVDTLGTPFDSTYWSHEIVVTDGTDSPTATIVVNPQANWARVDLAETPDVGTGSVLENFTGFYDDITAVSVANPSQLTLADTSDWVNGQEVTLSGFSTTPDINGTQTITIVNSTTVSIPVNVTAVTDGVGKMYTGAASEHGQLYYPTSNSTSITSAGILTTDKTSNFTVLYFDTVDSKWKPFTVVVATVSVGNGKPKGLLTTLGKMM